MPGTPSWRISTVTVSSISTKQATEEVPRESVSTSRHTPAIWRQVLKGDVRHCHIALSPRGTAKRLCYLDYYHFRVQFQKVIYVTSISKLFVNQSFNNAQTSVLCYTGIILVTFSLHVIYWMSVDHVLVLSQADGSLTRNDYSTHI